jgi:N-hydroxyarylamine O-acetyltransferase
MSDTTPISAPTMTPEMLDQFVSRIGLPSRDDLAADLPTLSRLTAAVTATVPFENLDCALGRGVDPSLPAVFAKVVTARRGGYCFENNTLMHHALRALGFRVTQRMARVVLGPSPSGFTHLVNIVRVADGGPEVGEGEGYSEYLVDVGFGACSLRAPLPLATLLDGASAATAAGGDGKAGRQGAAVLMYPDVCRLVDDDESSCLPPGALRLQCYRAGAWQNQYAFHPRSPVCDADIQVGSHYVSTLISPDNFFTGSRLAVLFTQDGKIVLRDDTLTRDRRVHCQDLLGLFPGRNILAEELSWRQKYLGTGGEPRKPAVAAVVSATAAADTASFPSISSESHDLDDEEWFDRLRDLFGIDLRWDHRDPATPAEEQRPPTMLDFLPGARGGRTSPDSARRAAEEASAASHAAAAEARSELARARARAAQAGRVATTAAAQAKAATAAARATHARAKALGPNLSTTTPPRHASSPVRGAPG